MSQKNQNNNMNATELFHADGRSAAIFYCEKCRIVKRTKVEADQCCAPVLCDCGALAEQYRTVCAACGRANEVKREEERFAKAAHTTEWEGPVFWEGTGCNDGFFSNVQELEEHLECEEADRPAYVWTCNEIPFVSGIMDRIMDQISENSYDDWDSDNLSGVAEFAKAVAAFEGANKDQVSWEPNYKLALILEAAETEEADQRRQTNLPL